MLEESTFEGEHMLDLINSKDVNIKVRESVDDKRERDEDREREAQRLIKTEDVKTKECHDSMDDSVNI